MSGYKILDVIRVSTNASGNQANGNSYLAALSADGTKVAFTSAASNLVLGDTNGATDVFVKDLVTNTITRASTDVNGNQGNSTSSTSISTAVLSADGTKVAFSSYASNLVPGDTNGTLDVFVKDLATNTITRASTDANGNQINSGTFTFSLSADGTKVAFSSYASNLVPSDTNNTMDVFVKDLATNAIIRASTDASGNEANDVSYYNLSLSADGSKVAFRSTASNLVPGDTNGEGEVFVKDLATNTITRVSTDANGNQANSDSNEASLSADGTKVAFSSYASNLVPGDTNGTTDVFVKDLATNTITRVSTDANGNQGNSASQEPALSADGTKVAFWSYASNLVPGDTNGTWNVFVKDLATNTITRVSTDTSGNQANNNSVRPALSADGTKVAFESYSSNFVPGGTNGTGDIFVTKLESQAALNHAPVAVNDIGAATENGGPIVLQALDLLANDTDVDTGDTKSLTTVSATSTAGAIVSLNAQGDVVYTPGTLFQSLKTGATTIDTFTYTMADRAGAESNATVTMTITGVNDAPVADDDGISLYEDASTLNLWNRLLANDTDVDNGDTRTIVAVDTASTVGSVSFSPSTQTLTYTADDPTQDVLKPGNTGTTNFAYTIRDSAGAEATAMVTVNIQGVMEPKNSGLFVGTGGNDILQGSPDADRMNAGAGNDLVIGAGRDDEMNGGEGRDTFVLGPNFGHDSIIGFTLGEDTIDARDFFSEGMSHAEVFNDLDQNSDGMINAADANAVFSRGRLTIDFDADNSLTLVGVRELTQTGFDNLFPGV